MSATVWSEAPNLQAHAKDRGNLHKSLYVTLHLDRFASEASAIVREMFPGALKSVTGVIYMQGVSRARGSGGCLAQLGAYFLAMKLTGQSRAAADRAIVWLEGVRDWLWCAAVGVPSDAEILAASRAEQEAEHRENISQMLLAEGINAETLARTIEAIEAEQARMNELKLLCRRRMAAER